MRFPDQSMEPMPLLPTSPAGLVSTPAVYVGAYRFTFYVQMALAGIVAFFMGLMGVAQMSMMSLEGKPEAQTASARAWAERNAIPAVEDGSIHEDHPLGADALPVRNSWRGAHPTPATGMGRSSSFFTPPSPPASPKQSRPPPPAPPMHPSLLSPNPARSTPPASPNQRAAELPLADIFAPGARGDGGMAGQRSPVLLRTNSDPPPRFGYSPSGSPSRSNVPYTGRRLG